MNKKIKTLITLALSLIILVGCSAKQKIIGTWSSEYGVTYTFNSDGTGLRKGNNILSSTILSVLGNSDGMEFTYTIEKDTITLTEQIYGVEHQTTYLFTLEDDILKLGIKSSDEAQQLNLVLTKNKEK